MAEWSNAAVLKTVEGHTSGGSNPSFSADKRLGLETKNHQVYLYGFFVLRHRHLQNAKRGRLEQNPSFSAKENPQQMLWVFCFRRTKMRITS